MSITALEMITDSLRASNIIDENQNPTPEMGVKCLRLLNQMMGQWDADGIRLGWVLVPTLPSVLPITLQDERAVKFNFAVEAAGEYGVTPLERVIQIADETYASLAARYELTVRSDLSNLPTPDALCTGGALIDRMRDG